MVAGNKDKKGIQCEIKYTNTKPGKEIITETEKKVQLIRFKTKKTIQKILITKSEPSQELVNTGYFYKIIQAEELMI